MRRILFTLCGALLVILVARNLVFKETAVRMTPSSVPAASPTSAPENNIVYVSPHGHDQATGSRQAPFGSIIRALSALSPAAAGRIILLEGIYKESINIPFHEQSPAPVLIMADEGADVIFDGGEPLVKWQESEWGPGLYEIEAPDIKTAFAYESGYLDIWDAAQNIRYRKQYDAKGVRVFPGSACLIDDTHILIHTLDGQPPKNCFRNRDSKGISIARSNLTLQGLTFRNYVGGSQARAITIDKDARDVVIRECIIRNCTRGISINGSDTQVLDCHIQNVGLGVANFGTDTVIENCLIENATGVFAFGDLNHHLRDGIRFYSPAVGGKVEGCITAGFWAGLYVKAHTAAAEATPMLFQNNIFLDGIRAGSSGAQPKNRYVGNIVGPNEDGVDPMKDPHLQPATFQDNYFFAQGGTPKGTNVAGLLPFVNLRGGNLNFLPDRKLPESIVRSRVGARSPAWASPQADWLSRLVSTSPPAPAALSFISQPTCASSQTGALITAQISQPATGILRYRRVGETSWHGVRGLDNTLSSATFNGTIAPLSVVTTVRPFSLSFALLDKRLEPDSDYEAQIDIASREGATLQSHLIKFRTSGPARVLSVKSRALPEEAAQGTFAQLQAALDHALPGDTVRVEEGVFTEPAVLVHGGTADLPITIQGAGETLSIFDGGKLVPFLLELRGVRHVVIRGLQFRWFGDAALIGKDSSRVTVSNCSFLNSTMARGVDTNGHGIHLSNSPHWEISHCTFTRLEYGLAAFDSAPIIIKNNTAFGNMYAAVGLARSCRDSEITGNSFTFTGNDSLRIIDTDRADFESLICDYNNYGALLRAQASSGPEHNITPASHYGPASPSKAIIGITIDNVFNRFTRMEDWQKFSGKDAHSIFADPQYIDPLTGDFRLHLGSVNILKAKDGESRLIGAASVAP